MNNDTILEITDASISSPKDMKFLKWLGAIALLCIAGALAILSMKVYAQNTGTPSAVRDATVRISKRVESIKSLDEQMVPIKERLNTLQKTRNLLSADNQRDIESILDWDYEYDWNDGTAHPLTKAIQPEDISPSDSTKSTQ